MTADGSPELITSPRNPGVRAAAALARRRERDARGHYLVEGSRAVADAVAAGVVVELFATPDAAADLRDVLADHPVPVTLVSARVLDRLADSVTPQGVVAVAEQRSARLEDVVGRGVLVVLCGVADPGNAGTVVRTADFAGAAGVVVSAGSVDPYNPKAVRAAAGSTGHLPIIAGVDLEDVLAACRRAGQALVALDAAGDLLLGTDPLPPHPLALLVGGEAHGLPAAVAAAADAVAAVPRHGRAESLNLAAAAAIAIAAAVWFQPRPGS